MSGIYPSSKSEDDYRCESDHRTLTEAAEIQADKGRMRGVKQHHRKTTKKMALVQRQMLGKR